MNPRRAVLLITSLVVAGLLAWFAVAKWDSASKVAAIISTLAAVAMVGLAVWTGLPAAAKVLNISASKTGKATARGSSHAISGVRAPGTTGDGIVRAKKTGDADASGGGDAVSGVDFS
jgi:hypothetical protein